jgi:hypothetical protein
MDADVIEASFVKVASTLADGTLRLVFDVEPNDAKDAFSLFNRPGTRAALARLVAQPNQIPISEKQGTKTPVGAQCIAASQLCKDSNFLVWSKTESEEAAKQFILSVCHIQSRKELDTDQEAANLFRTLILIPFKQQLKEST